MVRGLSGREVVCMGLWLNGLMIVWLCTGDLGCIFMGLGEGHGMIEDVLCVITDTDYSKYIPHITIVWVQHSRHRTAS